MNLLPWKIRELTDRVTNVVMNYTEVEARVREATNDEPWGPSGTLMQELASDTYMYETFSEVTGMLWKRIFHEGRNNWRRIYKGLLVVSYLLRHGSERFVTSTREHVNDLRALQNFTYHDERGKDQGINVRNKAKELVSFVRDNERLRDERKKAKKAKNKYVGMSSEDAKFGGGSQRYDDDSDFYGHRRQRSGGSNSYHDYPSDSRRDTHRRNESNGSVGYSDDFEPSGNDHPGRDSPRGVKYSFSVDSLEQHSDKDNFEEKPPARISTPTSSSTKPRRPITTSKKVSLGAAANYTGDKSPSAPGSKPSAPGIQQPSEPLDLFGASATPETSSGQNELFADFDSLAVNRSAASNSGAPAPAGPGEANGDFADFSTFQGNNDSFSAPPASVSNLDLLQSEQQPTFDPFANPQVMPSQPQQPTNTYGSDIFAAAAPNPMTQMNVGNVYQPNPMMPSNPPNPLVGTNLMAPQQPATSINVLSPTSTSLQNNSNVLSPMSMMGQNAPVTVVSPSVAESKPSKPNTWSDVKGVNIDMDLFGKSSQKSSQPSMREMKQHAPVSPMGNVTMGMAGMNMMGVTPQMHQNQMSGMMGQPMGMPQGMRMMSPQGGMMPNAMGGMPGQMNMNPYGNNMNQMYGGMGGGMYAPMQGVPASNSYNKPF